MRRESDNETSRPPLEETVVPVLAEELHLDREEVPTGGIRVHRSVQEREETVEMPLRKERVDVRRVLIDREVDGPLPVRREGGITIVPIVEEVVVVSKRFVLKEEIHISRSVSEEHHVERVRLKRQQAEIERFDADGRSEALQLPREEPRRAVRPRRTRILGDR